MAYLFQDLTGLALATLLAPLIFYLPGLGIVRLLARAGLVVDGYWQRIGWAMILALSLLPILDFLMIRAVGMVGVLVLNGPLALAGLPFLKGDRRGVSPGFLAIALIWWGMCAWSYVDFDWDGRLYQSLVVLDMVKHAAVTEQIARQGIPWSDPFFAREGVTGYYQYFYVWPAAVRWISGFGIDSRMAFGGAAFWTGIGVVALLWRIAADAAFIRPGRGRRVLMLAALLCFVAGADLVFMLFRYCVVHRVEPELDSWNTEIRMLGTSVLWVPHHVMAVVAAWTGMVLSVRAGAAVKTGRIILAAAAGMAFATTFGASVWIALTIAPLLGLWAIAGLPRRDFRLVIAGAVALILSFPQMHDIVYGRAPEAFPIAFGVRPFTVIFPGTTLASQLWCLLLLPVNYALEFGLLGLASILYWRSRKTAATEQAAAIRRLIFWSMVASLTIGGFLRSVIINNDLGWRSVLFAVMAVLLWTLWLAQSLSSFRRLHPFAWFLLILGTTGTLWDLAGLRIIRAPLFPTRPVELNSIPTLTYDLRAAYRWADAHLPPGAVIQHNPAVTMRVLEFGLYGHHWPAVADEQAHLFGASRQAIAERMAMLAPIYERPLTAQDIAARASSVHIDYLLFTRRDPVWQRLGGPPASSCLYRTPILCITAVAKGRPQ